LYAATVMLESGVLPDRTVPLITPAFSIAKLTPMTSAVALTIGEVSNESAFSPNSVA
jgi:hypothetical protein